MWVFVVCFHIRSFSLFSVLLRPVVHVRSSNKPEMVYKYICIPIVAFLYKRYQISCCSKIVAKLISCYGNAIIARVCVRLNWCLLNFFVCYVCYCCHSFCTLRVHFLVSALCHFASIVPISRPIWTNNSLEMQHHQQFLMRTNLGIYFTYVMDIFVGVLSLNLYNTPLLNPY